MCSNHWILPLLAFLVLDSTLYSHLLSLLSDIVLYRFLLSPRRSTGP